MITCNLCGTEKKTRREMHGHLMKMHYQEYKEVGFKQSELTLGQPEGGNATEKKEVFLAKKEKKTVERPAGFRLLNRNDPNEAFAYSRGYRYIDGDDLCYTVDEAKEEGFI